MTNKNELRMWAKSFGYLREERSSLLVEKLRNTAEYKQANNIMIFYPLKGEVNLLALLDDHSKRFFLPKIKEKNLLCCEYKKGDKVCKSCFNTIEPLGKLTDKKQIDLVIVPALCCDKNRYRLGYGGGFYDRFLADYSGKTIVCLPNELIIDTISPNEYDIAVDTIISC